MAVIKSRQAATVIKDAIVLDLGDVSRQAQRLRESAEAKAKQIIADAEKQAAAMTRDAHEQGMKEGIEEGKAQGLTEGRAQGKKDAFEQTSDQLGQLQKAWIEAAGVWDHERAAMEREARQAVLRLALCAAEKITHRTIEVDHAVAEKQLAAALAYILRPVDVSVNICEEDRPLLEQALPKLTGELNQIETVHLVDDASVKRGGCVVTYGQGRIDATIDTQLRRLVEQLIPSDETLADHAPSKSTSDARSNDKDRTATDQAAAPKPPSSVTKNKQDKPEKG